MGKRDVLKTQRPELTDRWGFHHSPNTNSMVWLRISRSSGVRVSLPLEIWLSPDMMATYCLPPASKVIGGALKPLPTLIFHSCSTVPSSHAANDPSTKAVNTRP